jgi:hypothetical protein
LQVFDLLIITMLRRIRVLTVIQAVVM